MRGSHFRPCRGVSDTGPTRCPTTPCRAPYRGATQWVVTGHEVSLGERHTPALEAASQLIGSPRNPACGSATKSETVETRRLSLGQGSGQSRSRVYDFVGVIAEAPRIASPTEALP
jgi:hypothetical protein